MDNPDVPGGTAVDPSAESAIDPSGDAVAATDVGRPESAPAAQRPFVVILAAAIVLGTLVPVTFLWVTTSQANRDAMTEQMTIDLTSLSGTFRTLADGDDPQALAFRPTAENLAAALTCRLEGSQERSGPGCRAIEARNLAVVDGDGQVVSAVDPAAQVPATPERTSQVDVDPEGGIRLPVTAVHEAGTTTTYVLLADNPLFLALQRQTPPTVAFTPFAVVGGVAIVAMLLVLLPLAKRRDDLLEQQEAAVAGLVKSKSDALRAANAGQRAQSDFLTSVSHRFRTPLQVIMGLADVMAKSGDELSPEQLAQMTARLKANATRLDDLLVDLLDVDRLTRGTMEPLRRNVDIRETVTSVALQADPGGRIAVQLPAEPVAGNVDVGHLERIVDHLLRNALRHSPADEVVEVTAAREDDAFLLQVSDRGPGIAPEHRLSVFDPLFRVIDGDPDPGIGVGLALVQRLAGAHGGRAWAGARPGGGTVMSVRIPDTGGDTGVDLWQLKGNLST